MRWPVEAATNCIPDDYKLSTTNQHTDAVIAVAAAADDGNFACTYAARILTRITGTADLASRQCTVYMWHSDTAVVGDAGVQLDSKLSMKQHRHIGLSMMVAYVVERLDYHNPPTLQTDRRLAVAILRSACSIVR